MKDCYVEGGRERLERVCLDVEYVKRFETLCVEPLELLLSSEGLGSKITTIRLLSIFVRRVFENWYLMSFIFM